MTEASGYTQRTEALQGTSGSLTDAETVVQQANSSNTDTGKLIRSGNPSSIVWHFVDFRFHGPFIRTEQLTSAQVNAFSQIAVSITELDSDGNPFIGNALMQVYNVAPHGGGRIEVRGDIHWDRDLNVRLNFIIVN